VGHASINLIVSLQELRCIRSNGREKKGHDAVVAAASFPTALIKSGMLDERVFKPKVMAAV